MARNAAGAANHGTSFPARGKNEAGEAYLNQGMEPVLIFSLQSNAMRTAAAQASGAPTRAASSEAARIDSSPPGASPARSASTAPAPKIRIGTYSGRIRSARSAPPVRTPSGRAAPI